MLETIKLENFLMNVTLLKSCNSPECFIPFMPILRTLSLILGAASLGSQRMLPYFP